MAEEIDGVCRAIKIIRIGVNYIPAMQVHENKCTLGPSCCNWKLRHCFHLETLDKDLAFKRAQELANRVGVPFLE